VGEQNKPPKPQNLARRADFRPLALALEIAIPAATIPPSHSTNGEATAGRCFVLFLWGR